MSVFKRLKDLTLAHIHSMIDKAEDPIQMIDQYLRNMQEDIKDAEGAVAAQIALEKKFQQLLQEQEEIVEKRDAQAHQAAQIHNLDLARRSLEEKRIAALKVEEYKVQYESNKLSADQLRGKLEEMVKQMNELKDKRENLIARANTAKAKTAVNKAMSNIGFNNNQDDFRRMEDKVRELEAKADISSEFLRVEKSLDAEFEELNKSNEIDQELAELMKKYETK